MDESVTFSRAEVDALTGHFSGLADRVPLGPIRTPDAYEAAVSAMNGLLQAGAGDADHPLAALLDLLGERIADYDDAHHRLADVPPAETLRLLMDQHGLRQGDLPEVGSQGVVSEVLSGRRALNLRQVRRLAERFHVAPATFL